MLKRNRLKKNHDFQRVISHSKQKVSKYFVIYYMKNNLNLARYGISISKKFINAVGRNKLRRRTRAILDNANIFNVSYDIIIIIRKPIINSDFSFFKKKLMDILEWTNKNVW